MKIYELMVILDGGLDEDKYKTALATVEKTIKTKGGTVTALDEWGKRKLVYAIRHIDFGYYLVFRLSADKAEVPAAIQSALNIQDVVLRSMMTLAKAKKPAVATEDEKPAKKVAAAAAKE
jgi:small subunit ribosomal protein S6